MLLTAFPTDPAPRGELDSCPESIGCQNCIDSVDRVTNMKSRTTCSVVPGILYLPWEQWLTISAISYNIENRSKLGVRSQCSVVSNRIENLLFAVA